MCLCCSSHALQIHCQRGPRFWPVPGDCEWICWKCAWADILGDPVRKLRRVQKDRFGRVSSPELQSSPSKKNLMRDNELGELASRMSSKEVTIDVYSFSYFFIISCRAWLLPTQSKWAHHPEVYQMAATSMKKPNLIRHFLYEFLS